jgi:hypothetical protein
MCFDHVLNLAIKDAFKPDDVAEAFRQVTDFINMMNKSPLRLAKLRECWNQLHPNGPAMPSLITYCPTRWIGTYETLTRFLVFRASIELFCSRHRNDPEMELDAKFPDFVRERYWECMEEIRLVLFPLAVVMQALQGEKYPTLAWTTVLFHSLKSHLESRPCADVNYEVFKSFRKALIASLKERFPVGFWTDAHLLAARLHPAIRHINSLGWTVNESNHLRDRADQLLEQAFIRERDRVAADEDAEPDGERGQAQNAPPAPPPADPVLRTRAGDFRAVFSAAETNRLRTFYGDNDGDDADDMEELNRYLRLRPLRSCTDPLDEWKRMEGEFPILARLARCYLAIPATNASVERLFSAAGNVYSEKRKALDPDTATAVIFLYSNRHFFWPSAPKRRRE